MRILPPFLRRPALPASVLPDAETTIAKFLAALPHRDPPAAPVPTHAAQFISDMHRTDGLPLFRKVVGEHGFCGLHLPPAGTKPSVLDADFAAAIAATRAQYAAARAEVYGTTAGAR